MATAAWGTYLTTFAITLNNHLPEAVSTLLVLYALLKIWYEQRTNSWYFVLAGLASGFAAANELPALSLVVVVGAGLAWRAPRQTLLCFVPALAVVALGFFLTNYLAHESLRPPYMHREGDDDWYAYPDSYWLDENRKGVDRGEPSPSVYALHARVGHHGVCSLTPVWGLSMIGLMMLAIRRDERPMPALALLIALLTVVCLTFYLTRPLVDRNYGGVTSGFRWMFWFTPLWLFAMIPVADWLSASRWSRGVALALLSVSVISASYPALNPWSHPWLFVLGQYAGWIGV
jgi:hypothetical protein